MLPSLDCAGGSAIATAANDLRGCTLYSITSRARCWKPTSVNALDHFHPTLENFEDMINWSLSQPMSDANAHDVIEPAISIRRCLEERRDPHVVLSRVDNLTAGDAVEHLFWATPNSRVSHRNNVFVVRLKSQTNVE